jgi:hypothetical protein
VAAQKGGVFAVARNSLRSHYHHISPTACPCYGCIFPVPPQAPVIPARFTEQDHYFWLRIFRTFCPRGRRRKLFSPCGRCRPKLAENFCNFLMCSAQTVGSARRLFATPKTLGFTRASHARRKDKKS